MPTETSSEINPLAIPCTAFAGRNILSAGPLADVLVAVKAALMAGTADEIFIFEDATGRQRDFDLRGSNADVLFRVTQQAKAAPSPRRRREPVVQGEPRGPGRPKLGVVGREVTLLPRHWDWLAAQPGGASVALRKLTDDARRNGSARQQARDAQEAAYHFMSALCGNLPGFEEATRALFAQDRARFTDLTVDWPKDFRDYTMRLASHAWENGASAGVPERTRYLEPTQENGRAFVERSIAGEVVMLNLLRFRRIADYSATLELAPPAPISGAEAYDRYIAHTLPFLRESGGSILFYGEGGQFLIGPADERWDRVMIVRQKNVKSFLNFPQNAGYLAGLGHRTAALEDSRLLPLAELSHKSQSKRES